MHSSLFGSCNFLLFAGTMFLWLSTLYHCSGFTHVITNKLQDFFITRARPKLFWHQLKCNTTVERLLGRSNRTAFIHPALIGTLETNRWNICTSSIDQDEDLGVQLNWVHENHSHYSSLATCYTSCLLDHNRIQACSDVTNHARASTWEMFPFNRWMLKQPASAHKDHSALRS